MNDEIKRILNDLDKIAKGEYYPEDLLTYKECQLLLDYITNLQEENEELKIKNDILEFRMKQNDRMVICERYRILKQRDDYKQRIDKAIKIIQNDTTLNPTRQRDRLINILNGGDE